MLAAKQLQHLAGALIIAELTKPAFLVRNVEQRLPCEKDKRPRPKVARLERQDFDLRAAIHFTTMNERLSPRLRIDIQGVSPSGRRTSGGPSNQGSLRGRGNVVSVRCRMYIQVSSVRDPEDSIFTDYRMIDLRGERQHDGKFQLTAHLVPGEQPFEVRMNELKDIQENDITWRLDMAQHYAMKFRFTFTRPSDAIPVFQALDLCEAAPQNGLWARWLKLPRCPTDSQPLPLFTGKDTTTKYVLNVNMGWGTEEWLARTSSKRQATPLETLCMFKRQKTSTGLLTPASTPRSNVSTVSTDVAVRFHVNGQVVTRQGYQCLFDKCRPREHGSIDRLDNHLATCHPGLRFETDFNASSAAVDETSVDIMIMAGYAQNSRWSGRGARRRLEKADSVIEDFEWSSPVDPNTPLILQKVRRDERWFHGAHLMRETPQAPLAPALAPPSEIKLELPVRVRQRRPVVSHPLKNVTFVSSDNKAALTPGEVLSDEDESVDESHLDMARSAQMAEQVPDPKTRRFLLDINAHIESEGLMGDKYLGPCIRRWLHKRRSWLKDKDTAKMFEEFAYAAWKRGYTSEEVYKECMDVSQKVRNDENIRLSPPCEEGAMRRGKETCSCGKAVVGVRDRVCCSNKDCVHPLYHKSCILRSTGFQGKNKLPSKWYCAPCLEPIRNVLNELEKAMPEPIWQLPTKTQLQVPDEDQSGAKQYWKATFEEHGFTMLPRPVP